MLRRLIVSAALVAALALPAVAAPPSKPMNVRGTVESLKGATLTVHTRDGRTVAIILPPRVRISAPVRESLADLKNGTYVGTTALPGTDGKLHAVAVQIFPPALRGVAEGHFPWDYAPHSTMTNADIAEVVKGADGTRLVLKYKGGTTTVEVGPDTPILGSTPGDRSLLKPGASVFVAVRRHSDGSLTALRIDAEKDGVKPAG